MVTMKRTCGLLLVLMLAGCKTMDGLSQDLKSGGDQIKKSGESVVKALKTE
jgi:predicted small secreted protein